MQPFKILLERYKPRIERILKMGEKSMHDHVHHIRILIDTHLQICGK